MEGAAPLACGLNYCYSTANVTGIEAFGEADINGTSSGIMGDLIEFKNTLTNIIDNNGQNYSDISKKLDDFTESINKMSGVNSKLGSISNKLEMSAHSLDSTKLNLKSFLSETQEVDLTETIAEWYSSQYAYQASMQVFTRFNSMSLLNYI